MGPKTSQLSNLHNPAKTPKTLHETTDLTTRAAFQLQIWLQFRFLSLRGGDDSFLQSFLVPLYASQLFLQSTSLSLYFFLLNFVYKKLFFSLFCCYTSFVCILLLLLLRSNPCRQHSKVLRRKWKTGKLGVKRNWLVLAQLPYSLQGNRRQSHRVDRPPNAEENPGSRYH